MKEPARRKRFRRRTRFDQRELVGARWWCAEQRRSVTPRTLAALAIVAGVVGVGLAIAAAAGAFDSGGPDSVRGARELSLRPTGFDETVFTKEALTAQRSDGWDVARGDSALDYPDACDVDATSAAPDAAGLETSLAPAQPSLAPYYVSTLFQSPGLAANASLRAGLRPVFSNAMDAAFGRGEGLRSLFEGDDAPPDVAIVADLPGPESVAFAAGLAPKFDPVFTFDNWPHPRGVVPAHLTLAAAVYYSRWFAGHRSAIGAPPLFVLDRNRLAPYTDDAGRFDNRYLARLPSAEQFRALGVKHVLYVIPAGAEVRELDDLNDDFVAVAAGGVDVKALSLADLTEPDAPAAPAARAGAAPVHAYRYGGHPSTHWWFWRSYGWRTPFASSSAVQPPGVTRGFEYVPAARPTMFSSAGSADARGIGRVTFHESSSSSGRSGSLGRGTTSVSG